MPLVLPLKVLLYNRGWRQLRCSKKGTLQSFDTMARFYLWSTVSRHYRVPLQGIPYELRKDTRERSRISCKQKLCCKDFEAHDVVKRRSRSRASKTKGRLSLKSQRCSFPNNDSRVWLNLRRTRVLFLTYRSAGKYMPP